MRQWRHLWNISFEKMRNWVVLLLMSYVSVAVAENTDYQVVPLPQSVQLQKGEPFAFQEGCAYCGTRRFAT